MTGYLPESPQLYPDDMLTDDPEQVLVAELGWIRRTLDRFEGTWRAERGDKADVAGARDVRAAAELDRPAHGVAAALPHGHDPHLVAVFLAEQRPRA